MPGSVLNAKDTMMMKIYSPTFMEYSKNLGLKRMILKSKYLSPYLYIYPNTYMGTG